jgi:hypothetical protein
LWDKGERKIAKDVVGFVERRIIVILFKPLQPTPTPLSLVLTIRFMVMM